MKRAESQGRWRKKMSSVAPGNNTAEMAILSVDALVLLVLHICSRADTHICIIQHKRVATGKPYPEMDTEGVGRIFRSACDTTSLDGACQCTGISRSLQRCSVLVQVL